MFVGFPLRVASLKTNHQRFVHDRTSGKENPKNDSTSFLLGEVLLYRCVHVGTKPFLSFGEIVKIVRKKSEGTFEKKFLPVFMLNI